MTAAVQAGAAGFLARYQGLRARLPGDLAERDAAATAFRAAGFPGRRDEAWHYTSLRPVADAAFHESLMLLADDAPLPPHLPDAAGPRIVLVNGRLREDLSDAPAGVQLFSFADRPRFGRLARPADHPLVALNTMLAEDGVVLDVPAGVDAGVLHLVSVATDVPGHAPAFHPRHTLRLGPHARLTLIETASGEGTYLHNPVTSVEIADGAVLTHVRLQDESRAAFHLSTLYADIAAGAAYDGFMLNLGGRVARVEIHARLTGPGAAAHLNGAQLLAGTQHADLTTVVRHEAPSCTSRQTVKNVLAGRARGVFQGRIEVARAAQKTDGYQMNQALLLSPDAEMDSKPQLEIYADDVKCSHGATVGALDPEQLFYLRSRGVAEPAARAMLVRAFLAEALDAVAEPQARTVLDRAVETWWQGQPA